MSLDSIATVQITTETAAIAQAGFGVPLILGAHTRNTDRIRFYTDLAGMEDDGFAATDAEYQMAARLFGQNPRPERVAVGRRANRPTMIFELTPTLANNTAYRVRVGGLTAEYVSDGSATLAEVTAGLATELTELGVAGLTVSDQSTFVRLTLAAGAWLGVEPLDNGRIAVAQVYAAADPAADLAAIAMVDSSWYAIFTPFSSPPEITAIAGWAEANGKLFFPNLQDTAVKAGTAGHIGATLKTAAWARTSPWFHEASDAFLAEGVAGQCLPMEPGSETWKYKQPNGVPASRLTTTEMNNLAANNVNYLYAAGGRNITAEGKVAAGEFIDIVRGRDWLQARLQERIFRRLALSKKIPFTDAGVAIIETEVRAQLQEGIESGFLAADPEPIVRVPRVQDVPVNDRAARHLTGIYFEAVVAGAIHKLTIRGVVRV